MNSRKSVLYILLSVLGLILIYNYMIAPLLMKNNQGMGMGMRMGMGMEMQGTMYSNTNYFIDVRFILLIAIAIACILIFEFLKPLPKVNKCSKCGNEIDDDRWKVCPACGNLLKEKRG